MSETAPVGVRLDTTLNDQVTAVAARSIATGRG
jgi:hypothetical protein